MPAAVDQVRALAAGPDLPLRAPGESARRWQEAVQRPGPILLLLSGVGLLPDVDIGELLDPLAGTELSNPLILPDGSLKDAGSGSDPERHEARTARDGDQASDGRGHARPRPTATGAPSLPSGGAGRTPRADPAALIAVLQRFAPAFESGSPQGPTLDARRSDGRPTMGRGDGTVVPLRRRPAGGDGAGEGSPMTGSPASLRGLEERALQALAEWSTGGWDGMDASNPAPGVSTLGGRTGAIAALPPRFAGGEPPRPARLDRRAGTSPDADTRSRSPSLARSQPGGSPLAPASQDDAGPDRGRARRRLADATSEAWRSGIVGVPPASGAEDQLTRLVGMLERAIRDLGDAEARLADRAAAAATGADPAPRAEPSVRWLEDDELAGRLQRILKHQARRHGIDLS